MASMRMSSQIPPTIFETFPRAVRNASVQSHTSSPAYLQSRRIAMAGNTLAALSFTNYKIENQTITSAAGVNLSDQQKVITGSVLDLFAGRPSLRKLTLWQDNAVFADPITLAEGRKQYQAQWYGLKVAFSDIQRLSSEVTSSGNPIEIEMKNKYTIKGIGSEQTVASKVKIHTAGEGDSMRITKVEDRWNDNIPDGAFATAMRNLNSVTVPTLVRYTNLEPSSA